LAVFRRIPVLAVILSEGCRSEEFSGLLGRKAEPGFVARLFFPARNSQTRQLVPLSSTSGRENDNGQSIIGMVELIYYHNLAAISSVTRSHVPRIGKKSVDCRILDHDDVASWNSLPFTVEVSIILEAHRHSP
jgi:hypothetical protein